MLMKPLLLVLLLALAGCQTTALSSPCDVLVAITPSGETNTFLVKRDKITAQQIAKHRGRYAKYRCGK